MFSWIKKLFKREPITKWQLFCTDEEQEIDLGLFEGSEEEAWDEAQQRQVNWMWKAHISKGEFRPFVGTYGIEKIE